MIVHAPHLPPKSCNIKQHERRQWLPVFILVTIMAFFSGLVGALVTVAWIVPPSPTGQIFYAYQTNRAAETPLDPIVENQMKERTIAMYDRNKKISGSLYPLGARQGVAILLSSDGWAVASSLGYRAGQENQWEGIDNQGTAHPIVAVRLAANTHLLYLKFGGDGFHIAPFARPDAIAYGASSWFFTGDNWKRAIMDGVQPVTTDKTISLGDLAYLYHLAPTVGAGDPVITDRGELLGLADDHSRLIPAWVIQADVTNLLSQGTLHRDLWPIDGQFVEGFGVEPGVRGATGFLVSRVGPRLGAALIKGDLILRLNNEPVDPASASRQVLGLGPDSTVTILRDGKEQDISLRTASSTP